VVKEKLDVKKFMRLVRLVFAMGCVIVGASFSVLLVRSYFVYDQIGYTNVNYTAKVIEHFRIRSNRGEFTFVSISREADSIELFRYLIDQLGSMDFKRLGFSYTRGKSYDPGVTRVTMLAEMGFWEEHGEHRQAIGPRFSGLVRVANWVDKYKSYSMPQWLLLAIALLYPVFSATRYWKRHMASSRLGRCSHCGYDLRASVGRCPECGTPIVNADLKRLPCRGSAREI
jgi:hypothetical protein